MASIFYYCAIFKCSSLHVDKLRGAHKKGHKKLGGVVKIGSILPEKKAGE